MSYIPSSAPSAQKFHAKSEEDWLLGLTICEELVKLNGMQAICLPREVIAAAVGGSWQNIQKIEFKALRKIRNRLRSVQKEIDTPSSARPKIRHKSMKLQVVSYV